MKMVLLYQTNEEEYIFSLIQKFLKNWQEKLQSELIHTHTGQTLAYRRCIELQVWEYIACLMGEVEVYRPMICDK